VAQVLEVIRERRAALLLILAGFSLQTLVMFAYNIWTPALFARAYGWTPGEVGLGFGSVVLIFGTSGVWFAGWLSDRLTARNRLDAQLRVAALASLGCGACGAVAPLMPNAWGALALIGPAIFLVTMPVPCAGIALQLILPNRARAQVTGVFYMVTGLVGLGLGPVLIGLVNDHVFNGPGEIRYSLALVVGIASPLMFLLLRAAAKPFRALREAQAADNASLAH
jgi:MFS family permease